MARYLGVAPWDLDDAPYEWFLHGLESLSAENWAEEEAVKRTQYRHRVPH